MPTGRPAGGRAKGSSVNRTGQSLHQMILGTMRDEALTASQIEQTKLAASPFAEYRTNPVGFIRQVLDVKVTPDIEELVNSFWTNTVTQGRSANGVGKTHGAAQAIVTFFFVWLNDGVQVYTFAAPPEDNLKLLLWGEIGTIVNKNPALFNGLDVKLATLHIASKHSNEFITGVTIPQSGDPEKRKARFSGKHAPHLAFVGDESDAVPGEIHEAIKSCMSSDGAHELLLFNPRAARGPIYQMEKENECNVVPLSAFSHPNVVTGKPIFPGAVSREVTCQRISGWTRSMLPGEKIDSEVYMVPEYLNGYRALKGDGKTQYPAIKGGEFRKIVEPAFSYMVLGRYSSQSEDQLISRADVEKCQQRWKDHVDKYGEIPPNRVSPIFSLDVADMGNDRNVLTKNYDGWIAPQMIWVGLDIKETADTCVIEMRKDDAAECFVDSNGVGAGVWPLIEANGLEAHRIMPQKSATDVAKINDLVVGEFYQMRDQGWWTMALAIKNNPKFMLPPDDELADELCAATWRTMRGKIKICDNDVMKERLGGKRSPDKASSLMQQFCPRPNEQGSDTLIQDNYLN